MNLKLFIHILLVVLVHGSAMAGPGELDTTFSSTGKSRVGFKKGNDQGNGAVTQVDGKLVVVGTTPNGDGGDFLVIRYNIDGSLDNSFDGDGTVMTNMGVGTDVAMGVSMQLDGRIVVAGYCDGNGTNADVCVARYNTDGSLDTQFGIGGKVLTPVTSSTDRGRDVYVQTDGKIVVVGDSFTNNSQADVLLVRYNANGSRDNGFGTSGMPGVTVTDVSPNAYDMANAVAVQSDGKIIVAGEGQAAGSPNFLIINRYTDTGSLDSTWGLLGGIGMYRFTNTGNHMAYGLTIQPDGKALLVGVADSKFMLVRFTNTGLFDNTFNGNGRIIESVGGTYDEARAVMVTGNFIPRITVAGYSSSNGNKYFAVARYTMDGLPDGSFNTTGKAVTTIGNANDAQVNAIASMAGQIAVAGTSFNGSNTDVAVARYTGGGVLDNFFAFSGRRIDDPGFRNAPAHGIAVQPDGKILVAGSSDSDSTGMDFAVARYNTNGSLDSTFNQAGHATTDMGSPQEDGYAVAVGPDGKVVVAGSRLDPAANSFDFAVTRYNSNGTPDESFNGTGKLVIPVGPGNDSAYGVAVQADNKIVIVGTTEVTPTNTDFAVLRLNVNGTPDNSFGSAGKQVTGVGLANDEAKAVRIQADGKIVVAGNSYTGSNSDFAVVRYTTGGIPDNQFGSFGRQITPIGSNSDLCGGLAIQPDGKIVLAGYAMGPTAESAQFATVRYGTNGIPDSSFDNDGIVTTSVGLNVSVGTSVAAMPDGRIVVSGAVIIGTAIDMASVRYLENGLLDNSYGFGGKAVVDVTGDGDIGWATAVDSHGRTLIAGYAQGLFGLVRLQGDVAPRQAPYDFDGDGKTDVSIVRPTAAEWWVLRSSNNSNFAVQFGAASDTIVPADYTGDGRADIGFFRPSTGQWFVLRSEDNSYFAFPFGTNGDIPVPADYDGDGKADPAVFRPSDGHWYIYRTSDGGTTSAPSGTNGDQPVPADYDGDGKVDVAIRRPSNGQWWLNRSTSGVIAYAFGTGTDRTVQGDYTGDGKADVAVWRPSTGEWFVLRSENTSFFSFPFGTNGDVPAPGDYDGDGKTDATVFRPAGSTWFANRSSGGVMTVTFGGASDRPVPNAYVR